MIALLYVHVHLHCMTYIIFAHSNELVTIIYSHNQTSTVGLGFKLVIPRCSSVGCVPTAGLDVLPSTTPYTDMQVRSEYLA